MTATIKCHGPGIKPNEKPCIQSLDPNATSWTKLGYHTVQTTNDTAPYNGIRFWRCPQCFDAHKKALQLQTL